MEVCFEMGECLMHALGVGDQIVKPCVCNGASWLVFLGGLPPDFGIKHRHLANILMPDLGCGKEGAFKL